MTNRAPCLFIGHGSPMNAIATNNYSRFLNSLGRRIARPDAILCISAHWLTKGTWVTHMQKPKTIHDFYGFPKELFDVNYPAPGSPETAELVRELITEPKIQLDETSWGFDHGTWSVLTHLYPKAEIPTIQLSIDMSQPGAYHLQLGEKLRALREKNILILGSGNITHNLRLVVFKPNTPVASWAVSFDEWVKKNIEERSYSTLANYFLDTDAGRLSVPTADHYFPLLYVLGASDKNDTLRFEYEDMEFGSLSMRSISFGIQ